MERTITIQTSDGPMDAFVASPDDGRDGPALVVAQEAFGVNSHIKSICRRLAEAGYVALAPELFHRSGRSVDLPYDDLSMVMPFMAALTNDGLTVDLDAALDATRKLDGVDGRRVGVIGFCMGGFTAFLAACRADVKAAVAYYGGGIVRERPGIGLKPLLDEADKIAAPILLIFGGRDQSIPDADVAAIRSRLESLRKPFEIVVYPEAGHGFFCDARAAYHQPSAKQAWPATLDWLKRNL